MKLPEIEDDSNVLEDSLEELLATIIIFGLFIIIGSCFILAWYKYIC